MMLRLFTGVVIGVVFAEPIRDAAKKSWAWLASNEDQDMREENQDVVTPPRS